MNVLAYAVRIPERTIALITLLALIAWALGLPAWINTARAAGLDEVSDLISDSDYGVNATHSITFTTSTTLNAGEFVRIYLDPIAQAFDFSGVGIADVASSTTHTVHTAIGSCGTGNDFYVQEASTTADYIDYTLCAGETVAADTTVNFRLGYTGTNDINNPTPVSETGQSYVVRIVTSATDGGAAIDEADTRVAIVQDVTVTAAVDTIFTFTINGVDANVTVNNDVTVTSGTSTATTVPFGVIAPNDDELMAQRLTVETNALNGFSVTVQADQTLTAGNGATIDTFVNSSAIASSTLWQGPAGTMGATTTYGHWGLTSDDNVVSSTTPHLWGAGYSLYQGNFVNNPVEVFYHNTAVTDDAGVGIGSTTVAYKVEISALQEAAKDYTATLTYIATPVF